MSRRIDKSWVVFASVENAEHDRCVDLFRRDVEDEGAWTPVAYYSAGTYDSGDAALATAIAKVAWLGAAVAGRRD